MGGPNPPIESAWEQTRVARPLADSRKLQLQFEYSTSSVRFPPKTKHFVVFSPILGDRLTGQVCHAQNSITINPCL